MTLGMGQIAKEYDLQASSNPKSGVVIVLKWISSLKTDWLMVFDNAECDPSLVEKFIPPGKRGNILITSRNVSMGRITSNNSVEVDEMNKEEAVSLLLKAGNVDITDNKSEETAMQIVSALFYLPLAIDQAGSYILSCQCSLNDYLKLYNKNYQHLLDHAEFKGASDYGKSVYGTWEVSIQEIESRAENQSKAAQSAIGLLNLIAFLHHANIHEDIFKYAAMGFKERDGEQVYHFPMVFTLLEPVLKLDKSGEWDVVEFQLGMQVLQSFSLIKKHMKMKTFSIHPLIQTCCQDRMLEAERQSNCVKATAFLTCAASFLNDSEEKYYTVSEALVMHIKANKTFERKIGAKRSYCDDEYSS